MNLFGIDLLQLIIYVCVAASFIVVVYILKLTRNKNKPKIRTRTKTELEPTLENPDQTIKQLIALIDKMWSHQVGLNSNSNSCPTPKPEHTPTKKRTRKKLEPTKEPETKELPPLPTQSHSIQKIDEETYTPTSEDEKLLETIRKQLGEK